MKMNSDCLKVGYKMDNNENNQTPDNRYEQPAKDRILKKYIFLVVIAVFALLIYGWTYLFQPDDSDDEATDKAEQENNDDDSNFNENDVTNILENDDNSDDEDETDVNEDDNNNDDNEEDLDDETIEIKDIVETAIALYVLHENEEEKWENITSEEVYEDLKEKMTSDGKTERELDEVDLFTVDESDNEVRYGAFAEWRVMAGDDNVSKRSELYYVTLEKEDHKWLVTEIRNTDAENMEEEG